MIRPPETAANSTARCNYPDCDGGPSTGYCHTDCRRAANSTLTTDERARTAYSIFRGGFRSAPCPVPLWNDAPTWVRDVVKVAYLQGTLDGKPAVNRAAPATDWLDADALRIAKEISALFLSNHLGGATQRLAKVHNIVHGALLNRAPLPSEEEIGWAAHVAFWLNTYKDETGTAHRVARETWRGAAKEQRLHEARAVLALFNTAQMSEEATRAIAPDVLAALRELLSGHDNLYVAHSGSDSDPRDDIAAKAARAIVENAQTSG